MENRVRGNEYRTTIVCIDSYENSVPMGRFYNPYDPQGESFCGLTRLLVRMTDLLDDGVNGYLTDDDAVMAEKLLKNEVILT